MSQELSSSDEEECKPSISSHNVESKPSSSDQNVESRPSTSNHNAENNSSSTNHNQSNFKPSNQELSSVFEDQVIYLHGFTEDKIKHYKRYIIAFDGDVGSKITDYTTHIVVKDNISTQEVSNLKKESKSVAIVTCQWLDDCISRRKLLKVKEYLVKTD